MHTPVEKKVICVSLATIVALYVAAGATQVPLATGERAEITEDGLHRVDPTKIASAWVKPELDLTRYTKMVVMPTGVSFRPIEKLSGGFRSRDSVTHFEVSDERKTQVRALFRELFYRDILEVDVYEIYDGAGRDVVMVHAFLVDVASGIPPQNEAVPTALVRSPWEAGIVLELRDSMSNDILARTFEAERVEEFVDAGAASETTRRILNRWSQLLCRRLEDLYALAAP